MMLGLGYRHLLRPLRRLYVNLYRKYVLLREAVKVWFFSPELMSKASNKGHKKSVRIVTPEVSLNLVRFQALCRRNNAIAKWRRHRQGTMCLHIVRHFYLSVPFVLKTTAASRIQKAWRRFVFKRNLTIPRFAKKLQAMARRYNARHKALGLRDPADRFLSINLRAFQAACYGFIARLKFSSKAKTKALENTAFPRLGREDIDGCDCWLQGAPLTIPKSVLIMLFGKFIPAQTTIYTDKVGVRFGQHFNGQYIFIVPILDTFVVYSVHDCHQSEGVKGLIQGHLAKELAILRVYTNEVKVLKFLKNGQTNDLTEYLVDQHVHVAHTRALLDTAPVIKTEDMVESRGEFMSRPEKIALRTKRRQENKALIAQGKKPKKIQLPYWAQGLNSQEYKEVRQQRIEWAMEQWSERGKDSLPQQVKEYFQTPRGAELWLDIHRWSLDQPEFAQTQLKKLNSSLKTLGLIFPLQLNPNIKNKMAQEIKQKRELREKQIEAAKARGSKSEMSTKLDAYISERKTYSKKEKEIDWSQFEEDSLPDLSEWGGVKTEY